MSLFGKVLRSTLFPYVLLAALLLLTFVILALRGLELGFVGDILGVEHYFGRLGVREAIRHTLFDDRKHFFLGFFYALVYIFFPGNSAGWYGSSIGLHLLNGLVAFGFLDLLLRGRLRWLSFSIVLVFVFSTRQVEPLFDIATGGHQKLAFGLVLLALMCHVLYVRRGRHHNLWHEVSLAFYIVSIFFYETTLLFFALIPLLSYIEDRRAGQVDNPRRWLLQAANDTLWYPVLFGGFWLVYGLLLPNPGSWLDISPANITTQIVNGFRAELWPPDMVARAAPVFEAEWLLLTLILTVIVTVGIALWLSRKGERFEQQSANEPFSLYALIVLLGLAMMAANIVAVAPGNWGLAAHPRLVYAAALGSAMLIVGGLAWLLTRLPNHMARSFILAAVVGVMTASGTSLLLQRQAVYQAEYVAREQVKAAILEAVPGWQGDTLPYILLISDVDPDALALHAQDIRFPNMFDLMYNTDGILADAVYYDVPETFPASARPDPDMPMSRYIGPYIVVEDGTVYSPLRPGLPIPLERLVIIAYDSATNAARVLESVPPDVMARGNIILRTPLSQDQFTTNMALIKP